MTAPNATASMHAGAEPAHWWSDIKAALALLTRLPVGRGRGPRTEDLARAGRVMPLIGALVGLVGAAAYWIAYALGLPPWPSALLALGATILVTGALHEDGLADVADGFGGAFEPGRKLEIMRTSDIGAFGVLALVLSVALRAGALAALAAPGAVAAALLAAHALARALLPAVMAGTPLARADGLAAGFGRPEPGHAGVALVIGGAIAVLTLGFGRGLAALAVAGGGAVIMVLIARAQIGGYTGDVLGAVEQVAETAVLLTLAAL